MSELGSNAREVEIKKTASGDKNAPVPQRRLSDIAVKVEQGEARKPKRIVQGEKLRGFEKVSRIPVKIEPTDEKSRVRKPTWIRAKFPGGKEVEELKSVMREHKLHSVCEEANCPNLGECFRKGVASFMIMGAICTRRCPFCDVAHGRPNPLDKDEPMNLAKTVAGMKLRHVVITSVDRDDLRDGGAQHFADCVREIHKAAPNTTVEILTPDFRGREKRALDIIVETPPDVFNHNLENVPRLYRAVRPGAGYQVSLDLLKNFKARCPDVPTKSGLMVGLGETDDEIIEVLKDMRAHDVDMLTLGQYLQPSKYHLPVKRYVTPAEFDNLKRIGEDLGFAHVAAGPMVRSSYHADVSAEEIMGNDKLAKLLAKRK